MANIFNEDFRDFIAALNNKICCLFVVMKFDRHLVRRGLMNFILPFNRRSINKSTSSKKF